MASELQILETPTALYQAGAAEFAAAAGRAVQDHGCFYVALSGGSTPRGLFSLLASDFAPRIPWRNLYFFWGDERHVPPDNPESNYRMARETLLTRVPVLPEHVFRIHAEEENADAAARAYEETLRTVFALRPGEIPRFDLVLLGIGTEGHTASLFPDSPALNETQRLVVANRVDKLNTDRITFTYPLLNNAAQVMFLVSGSDKAEILRLILQDANANLPAQRIRPHNGKLLWLADRNAASRLNSSAPIK
jgi:6-phosphogluconolactonase